MCVDKIQVCPSPFFLPPSHLPKIFLSYYKLYNQRAKPIDTGRPDLQTHPSLPLRKRYLRALHDPPSLLPNALRPNNSLLPQTLVCRTARHLQRTCTVRCEQVSVLARRACALSPHLGIGQRQEEELLKTKVNAEPFALPSLLQRTIAAFLLALHLSSRSLLPSFLLPFGDFLLDHILLSNSHPPPLPAIPYASTKDPPPDAHPNGQFH